MNTGDKQSATLAGTEQLKRANKARFSTGEHNNSVCIFYVSRLLLRNAQGELIKPHKKRQKNQDRSADADFRPGI